MIDKAISHPSIRANGAISEIQIHQGQFTVSVFVDGIEILTKIRGLPWTVGLDAEPWQIADAAAAFCEFTEGA